MTWTPLRGGAFHEVMLVDSPALVAMWRARQKGDPVCCAACGASHVALAIGEYLYQWCCFSCGRPSPWFRVVKGDPRFVGSVVVVDETPRGPLVHDA